MSLLYDLRITVMWWIAPVEKETVDHILENSEEHDHPEEFDRAGELRHILGLKDETYFTVDDTWSDEQ